MNFVSNNGLSMLGGDDLSSINQSIIDLDASVVHKTGYQTETINGLKTFTSNLVVSNANTTITATGTATDGLITLNATDPTFSGLYGQVQAYADTKIQLKMNASNSQVVMGPTSVSIIGDTTDTTTKNTETHSIGELASLTSGTFNVTDLVTTKTLLTMNDTYVKLQAPNFGSQLDIAGSLCHFDGVPSGTNALYFGSIEPFNTIGFLNTNLQFLNTDIGITQDSSNTAGRSIGISVLSSCVGDILFSLYKRTSSSFLTGSGFRWVRENATSNFLFQRRNTSSGGIGTNTTIQTITFDGATETFTAPTQNKVASTAFNVTDGTINHLAITPTQTTETNATITNVASTAFKIQNVSGTDKLIVAPSLTTITNTSVDIVAPCNATNYAVGTTATNVPLVSIVKEGTLLMGIIQSVDINTRLMWINSTFSCFTMSYPFSVKPIGYQLFVDNGSFTGTTTAVNMIVSVFNVTTGVALATTTSLVILMNATEQQVSGLFSAPTSASATDVLRIRFKFQVSSGTLTANNKGVQVSILFQQR